MAEKKYLDLVGLGQYDAKIKAHIDTKDAAAIKAAKDYADGLAGNYDAAGSAATAESNAKGYTDGKVTELNGTIAGVKTTAEQGVADAATAQAAADKAQGEVNALETYVGTFTHDTAKSVVEYINAKTDGIATSGNLEALAGRVTTVEGKVSAIEADYLVEADKTELQGKIDAVDAKADAAQEAADKAQSDIDAFMKATEVGDAVVDTLKEIQDYITSDLAAADQMTKNIAANAKAIEDEAAAREEAISDAVEALEGADSAQVARIEALEAKFTGDDSVADQIADAVAAEAALREQGDAAAEASAAAALKAAQDAQGEVDALEGVVETLTGVVNGKVAQGDHDALAGRVTANEQAIAGIDNHSHDNKAVIDGITAALIGNWNDAFAKAHEHANKDVLDGISAQLVTNWNAAEGNAKAYTDEKIAEFVAITSGEVDALFA